MARNNSLILRRKRYSNCEHRDPTVRLIRDIQHEVILLTLRKKKLERFVVRCRRIEISRERDIYVYY